MINTIIIEEDIEVRNAIKDSLSSTGDLRCAGTFRNAREFVDRLPSLNADVVVVDIPVPGLTGIRCVSQLKPKKQQVQYLVSHADAASEILFDALCGGAKVYLKKNAPPEKLFQAIRDIHNGETSSSHQITRLVVSVAAEQKEKPNPMEALSSQQQQILHSLAGGSKYKEIAEQLSMTDERVRSSLRRIYAVLEVRSKTDALHKVFPKSAPAIGHNLFAL
jgi:DNA-binding NarL/FixJ family response regulator